MTKSSKVVLKTFYELPENFPLGYEREIDHVRKDLIDAREIAGGKVEGSYFFNGYSYECHIWVRPEIAAGLQEAYPEAYPEA